MMLKGQGSKIFPYFKSAAGLMTNLSKTSLRGGERKDGGMSALIVDNDIVSFLFKRSSCRLPLRRT